MSDPNDAPLRWFVQKMFDKLSLPKNVGKTHWTRIPNEELAMRIDQEHTELLTALKYGTPEEVISECCDIANFAMMIADNCDRRNK